MFGLTKREQRWAAEQRAAKGQAEVLVNLLEMILGAAEFRCYPSMGKTALTQNIAEHVALEHNKAVLFFSLETINGQLGLHTTKDTNHDE